MSLRETTKKGELDADQAGRGAASYRQTKKDLKGAKISERKK